VAFITRAFMLVQLNSCAIPNRVWPSTTSYLTYGYPSFVFSISSAVSPPHQYGVNLLKAFGFEAHLIPEHVLLVRPHQRQVARAQILLNLKRWASMSFCLEALASQWHIGFMKMGRILTDFYVHENFLCGVKHKQRLQQCRVEKFSF